MEPLTYSVHFQPDAVLQHQNHLLLEFSLRHALSKAAPNPDEDMVIVRRLFVLRRTINIEMSQPDGQSTEMVALGDVYATLAVRRLLDLFLKTSKLFSGLSSSACLTSLLLENWSWFADCIVLLEGMLRKPKHVSNPSFRLLLIQLYTYCGNDLVVHPFSHFDWNNWNKGSLQVLSPWPMTISVIWISNLFSSIILRMNLYIYISILQYW